MKIFFSFFMFLVGASCLASSYSSFECFLSGLFFFLSGIGLIYLSKGLKYELEAFSLSYGLCILVAGCVHLYAEAYFNDNMTALDAKLFRSVIIDYFHLNIVQLQEVLNSPLPVYMWSKLRYFFGFFNIKHGAWVDIQFNAFLVAMSGFITIKCARLVHGKKSKPLAKLTLLYAACGSCILFGAILIRDCYALFINTLWLYFAIRLLTKPKLINWLLLLFGTLICAILMFYTREKASYLFALFLLIAASSWYLSSGFSPLKIILALSLLAVFMVGYDSLSSGANDAIEASNQKNENYAQQSQSSNSKGSLGYTLIVDQPMPIRAIAGSIYMIIFPIPIWAYFELGTGEYQILKGYQGAYMIYTFPLVALGILASLRRIRKKADKNGLHLFLVVYLIITLSSVALTSLETRHYGQFIPAALILATLVNSRDIKFKQSFTIIRNTWVAFIVFIHIAWASLKFLT